MATFVEGLGNQQRGYPKINLDLVARVERRGSEGYGWDCFTADGDRLGAVGFVSEHPATVIADTTGTILIGFWPDCSFRYPVLAWAIADGTAEPVICESLPDHYCLELREAGQAVQWVFVEDRCFAVMDEAMAYGATLVQPRPQVEATPP